MKVLKFGAVWCKECLVMKPMWAKIEEAIPELQTEYYEADENPEVLEKYGVENIPTFIFLDKEGKEFDRLQGMQNEDELMEKVKANLDK
jgi:thioredoxin-like negative regulator of GroEL